MADRLLKEDGDALLQEIGDALLVAEAAPEHATSGALTGPGSAVDGTAARTRVHATTGALTGPGSTVDGTAVYNALHGTSGDLVGAGVSCHRNGCPYSGACHVWHAGRPGLDAGRYSYTRAYPYQHGRPDRLRGSAGRYGSPEDPTRHRRYVDRAGRYGDGHGKSNRRAYHHGKSGWGRG